MRAELRLLATSDLHANLTGEEYTQGQHIAGIGLAALAPVIAQARAETPNCLYFDNGDLLEGTALGEEAATRLAHAPHPMITALNALNCDAATPGNHDFGFGLEAAVTAYRSAEFPIVASNLWRSDGTEIWPSQALLTRSLHAQDGTSASITIGVLGLLPPQVMLWERRALFGRARAGDIVEAARTQAARLKADGADIVVALCHSGISATAQPGAEDAALQVAAIRDVDAVIAGHKHRRFPGPDYAGPGIDPAQGTLAGTPAVMPGWRGSHLGVIDLALRLEAGAWSVQSHAASLRPAVAVDPDIAALAQDEEAAIAARLRRPLGQSDRAIHSYFSHLPGSTALVLVARAAQDHAARRLAAEPRAASLPIVAAAAPARAGGYGGPHNYTDIPPGPLSLRAVHNIVQYPNQIAAFETTGATLRQWIAQSASLFSTVAPGSTGTSLLRPGAFPGIFHHFEGVTYEIDLSADGITTPRIRDLRLAGQGTPINDGTPLVLVTTEHRLWGGGGVPAAPQESILFDGPQDMRGVLGAYLSRPAGPDQIRTPSWRFTPLGARLRYQTGPGAAAHLGEIAEFNDGSYTTDAEGFLQIALDL